MNTLKRLEALDRGLVTKGWPALSPWWRETLGRWLESARRQLVARVGRRGGKSSTLARLAVAWALSYDVRLIPPGDIGVVAFISVSRDEANQRLRTIKQILDALHVEYKPIDGGIELVDRPIAFKVFTASIAGVSGFTSILVICDEVSKWRDSDTGANPAAEVLASVRPTIATQPHARIVLSSSPLGLDDAHAKAFEAGETDFQCVAFAPTWLANPTISEQQTRDLERNERVWKREYAAIPQGGVTSVFDPDTIARSMDLHGSLVVEAQEQPALVIDASRGGDAWTWALVRWIWAQGKARLRLDTIGTVPDARDSAAAVAWLESRAKAAGATAVIGDQYEAGALNAAFSAAGFTFYECAWTAPSKRAAVDRAERMLRDETLLLVPHDVLRRQMHEYSERITRGGELSYGGKGRHDDHAAVVITAMLGDMQRRIHAVAEPMAMQAPVRGSAEWAKQLEEKDLELLRRQKQNLETEMYGITSWVDPDYRDYE